MTENSGQERTWWLDRKENVTKIARALYIVCGLLLLADIFRTHPDNEIDAIPLFYGIYGFIGGVVVVMASKQLRKIVMRRADYYDD